MQGGTSLSPKSGGFRESSKWFHSIWFGLKCLIWGVTKFTVTVFLLLSMKDASPHTYFRGVAENREGENQYLLTAVSGTVRWDPSLQAHGGSVVLSLPLSHLLELGHNSHNEPQSD